MPPLLADVNFNGRIVRGLFRRLPGIDLLRAQDVGLANTPDPLLLEWAAGHGRVLLTHDGATMIGFAYDRVRQGLPMPGVFFVRETMPIGQAIDGLLLAVLCGVPDDWDRQVIHFPL